MGAALWKDNSAQSKQDHTQIQHHGLRGLGAGTVWGGVAEEVGKNVGTFSSHHHKRKGGNHFSGRQQSMGRPKPSVPP